MAEKIFNTRILLKYDSYTNWTTNNPVLKAGEMAIAYIQTGDTQEVNSVTAPQVLIKVGDGTSAYNALPFASAKAADVYSWAKAATKPEYQASEIKGLDTFIASEIQDTDTQYKLVKVNDYQYKMMSKAKGDADYTTEVAVIDIPNDTTAIKANADAIDALGKLVGDTKVTEQIAAAIAALNLANTYDAKGSAAQALTDANAYTDGKNTAMDSRVKDLEAKFGEGEGTVEAQIAAAVAVVQGEVDALETLHGQDKAALEGKITEAKKAGDDAQDDVDALSGKVGIVPENKNVVGMIAEAQTAAEKVANDNNAAMSTRVKAIEDDYLKAADKTELAGDISDNASAITALQGLVGDKKVSEQISTVTNPIAADVTAIKGDYLKSADKSELQGNIDNVSSGLAAVKEDVDAFFANADMTENAKDTLKELQEYIKSDETAASSMAASIKQNADAISAEAAKVSTLQTEMDAVEQKATDNAAAIALKAAKTDLDAAVTRIAQNETDISTLEGEVAKKAAQADHEALAGRVTTAEGDIIALEGEMDSVKDRALALEQKVGDETVSAQINAAITALKIGDYAKAADLTAAVARIAQNEKDIDALESRATAVEGRVTTLETEIDKKANDADLAAIAKSGNVNDLAQTEGDVLVFDCGTSA